MATGALAEWSPIPALCPALCGSLRGLASTTSQDPWVTLPTRPLSCHQMLISQTSVSSQTRSDPTATSPGMGVLRCPQTPHTSPKQTSCLPTPVPRLHCPPTPEVSTQEVLKMNPRDKEMHYVNPIKRGQNKLPQEPDRKSYPILQMRALSLGGIKGPAQEQ